jgi:transposase-like protein
VKVSTATLANWVTYTANVFLKLIYAQMKREVLYGNVIHADETVVQVLHEPSKKAKTDSRMWVYCSGKYEKHRNILFEYQSTRNDDHAKRFLRDFSGYLVCDGLDGYNSWILSSGVVALLMCAISLSMSCHWMKQIF